MYFIIVGGGQLGLSLAHTLIAADLEVLVVEKSTAAASAIAEELGNIVLWGDGCEVMVLDKAGANRADLFIAVTGDDADNLVACQVAKQKFHVPRTIARVRDPAKEPLFQKLDIESINTTQLILERLRQEILPEPILPLLRLKGHGVTLASAAVPSRPALVGKAIASLPLPAKSRVLLLLRPGLEPFTPQLDTIVEQGDTLIISIPTQDEKGLVEAFK